MKFVENIFSGNNDQDEAVEKVVEFMDTYSISQEDFDTIVEISKFRVYLNNNMYFLFPLHSLICLQMQLELNHVYVHQGHPNPMDGIQPAVKAALTKAYNKGSSSRVIRTADMVTLPGMKKALKKRVAAILEPVEESLAEDNGDAFGETEENSSEAEDLGTILTLTFPLFPS